MKKDLLKLLDLSREEIVRILDVADQMKYDQKHRLPHPRLQGKTLAMIFEKNSTRTRVSFETGMYQLGGNAIYLSDKDSQIGRNEPVEDTARVLSRFCDGIMIRTFAQEEVETLAKYASIPVINGLTDFCHPCQVLADLMTIREHKGKLAGLKLCYIGDGNNMANSLIVGGLKCGMTVSIACPDAYRPDPAVLDFAQQYPGMLQCTPDILAAAKDIYKRGTTYNYMLTPRMTVTADKSTAYPVTIGGQAYLQQVFTIWSETWVYDYDVSVAFSDPDSVPEGTKIVDANNKEITAVTTKYTSDGYAGTFKVLYPAGSVEGQSGNVQFSLSAPVAQYAAMYAVCQEKDQYGDLQNYICDLDNKVQLDVAAVSSYADSGEPDPDETALKIVKLEEGTEIPLEGAVFSVYDPEGKKVGSFSTGPDGTVTIPLTLEGHYTITEEIPPRYHLLPEETTQHADVEYNKTATLTFWNAPYGSLRVEKRSDTGDALSGVTIQIKHIETGETRTEQTRNGVVVFDELAP